MYERMTDRARKVMQLANQEAQRFNHEYVGTEHILLDLVKEGTGIAGNVLQNLGVDVGKVRSETEKMLKPGPDFVTMGKLPLTPRAKKIVEAALDEAASLGHTYVGTEHLLLGCLQETEGVACIVLMNLGVKLEECREEVLALIGKPKLSIPVKPDATMQAAFLQFARNGRWGTCGECPADGDGIVYPEMCQYTRRYDHLLTLDVLVEQYKSRIKQSEGGGK